MVQLVQVIDPAIVDRLRSLVAFHNPAAVTCDHADIAALLEERDRLAADNESLRALKARVWEFANG